jgi:hypothetical protein
MADIPVERYAPGGDIYGSVSAEYGPDAAQRVYAAARTGDRYKVTQALSNLRFGAERDDSVLSNFISQVTTDPFAAPLETANRAIGTIAGSAIFGLFKNPWVLLAGAGAVYYFFFFKKR